MVYVNAPYPKSRSRLREERFRQKKARVVYSVNHDGLILARARRRSLRLPVKGLMMITIALIGFKLLLVQSLGTAGYNDRLQGLVSGTPAEQVGAYVMQIDPVTQWLSARLSIYL